VVREIVRGMVRGTVRDILQLTVTLMLLGALAWERWKGNVPRGTFLNGGSKEGCQLPEFILRGGAQCSTWNISGCDDCVFTGGAVPFVAKVGNSSEPRSVNATRDTSKNMQKLHLI